MNLLRTFDRLSFWLGFLAGSLFWLVASRLWPWITASIATMRQRIQQTQQEMLRDIEIRYRRELTRYAQGLHLAAPLFALDEILVPPRVLLEDILPESREEAEQWLGPDAVASTVFWTPDWPDMAGFYRSPSAPLTAVLGNGVHIALLAPLGYGKTVALASLALACLRNDETLGTRRQALPLLAHVDDLDLEAADPLEGILAALRPYTGTLVRAQFPSHLRQTLQKGERPVVLLLDGLDEHPPEAQRPIVDWLARLLEAYPSLQVVVAADPGGFDGLLTLRFTPVALSTWSLEERYHFLRRWTTAWERLMPSTWNDRQDAPEAVDPLLIGMWLREGVQRYSPLELTLRTWGALAGDLPGARPHQALTGYLRRFVDDNTRPVLESIAAAAIERGTLSFTPAQVKQWLHETDEEDGQNGEAALSDEAPLHTENTSPPPLRPSQALRRALDSGLLLQGREHLRFLHPALAAHLAASALSLPDNDLDTIFAWGPFRHAMRTLAARQPSLPWLLPFLDAEPKPFPWRLLSVGRWLSDAPPKATWRVEVLRRLALTIHNPALLPAARHLAALALSLSGDTGVTALYHKLLATNDAHGREIAALSLGFLSDRTAVPTLKALLLDPEVSVACAGALALVAIGTQEAVDSVAYLLLHGDDDQRRMAAEALANHLREGDALLQEAITLDDPPVRRAAIFGLRRIPRPWAQQAIEQLQFEDDWLVKNTALQVIEEHRQRQARLVERVLPLTDTPWLNTFAAGEGLGVAPGAPAVQMLIRALQRGDVYQQSLAARRLRHEPTEAAVAPLYHAAFGDNPKLGLLAWQTLWYLRAAGVPLPLPQQFGLGGKSGL